MVVVLLLLIVVFVMVVWRRANRRTAPPVATPPASRPSSTSVQAPSPLDGAKPFVGGPPTGTKSSLPMDSPDVARIRVVLGRQGDLSAGQIASAVNNEFGCDWDKTKANSVIYRMEYMGLVHKRLAGKRPLWSLTV